LIHTGVGLSVKTLEQIQREKAVRSFLTTTGMLLVPMYPVLPHHCTLCSIIVYSLL